MEELELKRNREMITGFDNIFESVNALRLSLHGYIIVVGKSPRRDKTIARYLIYSLNGDLLRMVEEFLDIEIKSVFLNTREDWLIVAGNITNLYNQKREGNFRVLNLYGLNTVADLSEVCYTLTLKNL